MMKYLMTCSTTGTSGRGSYPPYHKFNYQDFIWCMTRRWLFSDASEDGYGMCAFLRFVHAVVAIRCSFLIGRSRSSPVRPISIPIGVELVGQLLCP